MELNPNGIKFNAPAITPPSVSAGVWETSGIIDTSDLYGKDFWLFVVQAHSPSIAPVVNTVEDGQLLLMKPASKRGDKDGDGYDD